MFTPHAFGPGYLVPLEAPAPAPDPEPAPAPPSGTSDPEREVRRPLIRWNPGKRL